MGEQSSKLDSTGLGAALNSFPRGAAPSLAWTK